MADNFGNLAGTMAQGFQTGMQVPGRTSGINQGLQTLLQMMQQSAQQKQQFQMLQQLQTQKEQQETALQTQKGQQLKDIWSQRTQSAQDIAGMKAGAALNKPIPPSQQLSEIKKIQAQHPIGSRLPWGAANKQIQNVGSIPSGNYGGQPQQGPNPFDQLFGTDDQMAQTALQ